MLTTRTKYWSRVLKLINYSCSQKPINELQLGQVDESLYPNETPPGFHLGWNMFFIWDQTFLIVSFEKTCKKLGPGASSRVPNTEKQMKARGGTHDETLALVFDILLENLWHSLQNSFTFFTGVLQTSWFHGLKRKSSYFHVREPRRLLELFYSIDQFRYFKIQP